MTYKELIKKNGGHITWTENHDGAENMRSNLDQLGCIHIEYKKNGKWYEWEDSRQGNLTDSEFLDAVVKTALDFKTDESVVWVVERNFKTPEMNSDDWRYLAYPHDTDDEKFDSDWNVAIKCHDRGSAVRLTHFLYDEWDIRVTDHQIVSPTEVTP